MWPVQSVNATNPSVGTSGSGAPGSATLVGGINPSGNLNPLHTDASNQLLVNVGTSSLPTGAATAANQSLEITQLDNIAASTADIDSHIIHVDTNNVTVVASALPTGAATNAELVTINSTLGSPFQAGGSIGNTAFGISGSLPAGSNAIGSVSVSNFPATQPVSGTVAVSNFPATQPVSGTVAVTQSTSPWIVDGSGFTQPISASALPLPTGAATSALQTTGNTSLADIDTTVGDISAQLPATLGQKTMDNSLAVAIASDQSSIPVTVSNFPASQPVSIPGKAQANAPVYNIYSSAPIDTSAYVQLIASSAAIINYLDIFDSSGQAMILATGAMGSEVPLAYVPPGGDEIPVAIPSGTRISYKALTANATAGYLLFNSYT